EGEAGVVVDELIAADHHVDAGTAQVGVAGDPQLAVGEAAGRADGVHAEGAAEDEVAIEGADGGARVAGAADVDAAGVVDGAALAAGGLEQAAPGAEIDRAADGAGVAHVAE